MDIQDYITAKERSALFKPKKYSLYRFINQFKKKRLHKIARRGRHEMLILQRHPGQSIWVGNEIQVVVLGSSGDLIRLGIVAPPEFKIVPEEIRSTKGIYKP